MRYNLLKKIAGICVALCFLCCTGAIADSDTKIVSCKYLKEMDLSVDSWYALDFTREYFVTAMVLDCLDEWTTSERRIVEEALAYDTTYMAKDGNSINVFAFGKNGTMMFRYNVETGMGFYSTTSIDSVYLMADKYMKALGEQYSFSSYYKVDRDGVLQRMDSVTK